LQVTRGVESVGLFSTPIVRSRIAVRLESLTYSGFADAITAGTE
jgi:hypothetical protein